MQSANPPNKRYYGWYIATTLAITETISWGILYYAFSVFIAPMEATLGWSRSELTGAFSLALLIAGGMAFPVGYWIDRHGARLLMSLASVAAAVLVLTWSQVNDLTTFYLIWAGMGVCLAALLYEPAFTVVAIWFERRRSTALALVTFTAGLASTIFLPLSNALLETFGWREALFILGIFLALTTIPLHIAFLRRRPADMGLLPDGESQQESSTPQVSNGVRTGVALSTKTFWSLTIGFSLTYLAASAIRVHFIPFLLDMGIDAGTAAFATGAIGLMQVVGRVIFAPLDNRLSGRMMVIGIFGLQAVAMFILLLNVSIVAIGLFIILFGAAIGANTLVRPSILADLYGSSHYGRISSVMAIFLTLARTIAPVSAGLLYDSTGSYNTVLWLIFGLSVVAIGSVLFINLERPAETLLATAEHAQD